MNLKVKKALKYFGISQLFLVGLFIFLLIVKMPFAGISELLTTKQIIYGFCLLELWCIASCILLFKETKVINDEREKLIALKSKDAAFTILLVGMGLYNLFLQLAYDRPLNGPLNWFILLGVLLNFIFVKFYRRVL